jgi:hypothetical protein
MTRKISFAALTAAFFVSLAIVPAAAQDASTPLVLSSAKVSIAGTSNIHEFTATTTDVRVTRLALAAGSAGPGLLAAIVKPGAVESFEIAVRTAKLSSPKEGIDKNMHKALKATEFPDITFKLLRLEATPAATLKAFGLLKIAGVEREIAFDLRTTAAPGSLTITGDVPLLMTQYGIAPPKAMLGMLKTDPKITVTFEVVLAAPATLTR